MTNEIAIKLQPLMMKSGLVHWIKPQTADNIQQAISGQSAHTFVKISELNITINTAQVEGVYTVEQYDDIVRLKQGMYQCSHRKWHEKKQVCECAKEERRKLEERLARTRQAEINRELTDAERRESFNRYRKMQEISALKGSLIFRNLFLKGGTKKIRRSTINEWEQKHGRVSLEDLAIEEDVNAKMREEALQIL